MEQGSIGGGAEVEPSSSSRATAEAPPSTSQTSNEYQALLGNIEIPEGVDPSFLAALPEDMRQEVIAEQLRLQRLRQRARAQAADASNQVRNWLIVLRNYVNIKLCFPACAGSKCGVFGCPSTEYPGGSVGSTAS